MAKDNVSVETSKVGGPGLIDSILCIAPIINAIDPERYETKVSGSKGSVKSSGKTESESVANAMKEYSRR